MDSYRLEHEMIVTSRYRATAYMAAVPKSSVLRWMQNMMMMKISLERLLVESSKLQDHSVGLGRTHGPIFSFQMT